MNKRFLLFVLLLACAMFVWQYQMPRRFSWQPSYHSSDRQPFGCYVFDSVMRSAMPHGYQVTTQSLWQLSHDSTQRRSVILLTGDAYDVDAALSMARRGCRLLVLCESYGSNLADTLGVDISWFAGFDLRQMAADQRQIVTLQWLAHDGYAAAPTNSFCFDRGLVERHVWHHDSATTQALAQVVWQGDSSNVVVSCSVGRGEVVFVTMPLLFTNYGVLNSQCRPVVARVMNHLKDLPVVRIDSTPADAVGTYHMQSPLYVFLERPPLRWAITMTVVTLLLFMGFTARRRQRVIPVMRPPANGQLDFIRLIGTLYYQRGQHRDLLQKKLAYMAAEVRMLTGIDLAEEDAPQRIARQAGLPEDEVRQALAQAQQACRSPEELTGRDLRRHIDRLNSIIDHL